MLWHVLELLEMEQPTHHRQLIEDSRSGPSSLWRKNDHYYSSQLTPKVTQTMPNAAVTAVTSAALRQPMSAGNMTLLQLLDQPQYHKPLVWEVVSKWERHVTLSGTLLTF